MNKETVTCSFTMDRDLYNAYKSVISSCGENVKGNLVRYMKSVVRYETPNAETIRAIQEVQELKKDPNKKVYHSFGEILAEMEQDDEVYDRTDQPV
jgi:hypothetical protein